MKNYRLLVLAAIVALGTVTIANAQQSAPRTNTPTTTAQPQAGAAGGINGIAIINTAAFTDDKEGITKLVNASRTVEREFTPRQQQLQQLAQRIQASQTELENLLKTPTVSPQSVQQKREQIDQLQRELTRSREDAQISYNKRIAEVAGPIYDDIAKALETFARQRNINVILDEAKLAEAMFVVGRAGMDITRDFVADYNRRNPATASAAPATPRR